MKKGDVCIMLTGTAGENKHTFMLSPGYHHDFQDI